VPSMSVEELKERLTRDLPGALAPARAKAEHANNGGAAPLADPSAKPKKGEEAPLDLLATADAIVLSERIPDCHLIFVYDAAHNIEVDQPDRFLTVVRSFLDRGKAFIVNWGEHAVAGIDASTAASGSSTSRETLALDSRDHVHF